MSLVPELDHAAERRALRETGAAFHARLWSIGTGGNFSVVVSREPLRLLITASGADKGRLGEADFTVIDGDGEPVDAGGTSPSAEAFLHAVLARDPSIGAVLHTHSVWATLLSDLHATAGAVEIAGYEMLKGLDGVTTHEHTERVEIFDNTQDMPALAGRLAAWLESAAGARAHGFLLRGHGLYTWGRSLEDARRHVEVLEFLLEVLGRRTSAAGPPLSS